MKRDIPIHRKDDKHALYQASRLEGVVRNIGSNPVRKPKKPSAQGK